MRKVFLSATLSLILSVLLSACTGAAPKVFPIVNEKNEWIRNVNIKNHVGSDGRKFSGEERVRLYPEGLHLVARETLKYLNIREIEDPVAVRGGIPGILGYGLDSTRDTLAFVQEVLADDLAAGNLKSRLASPSFLNENFSLVRFYGERDEAQKYGVRISPGKVRITKYAVFKVPGSTLKTARFSCALYGLPDDEAGLSAAEAEKIRDFLTRFRYTKQEVLSGVYEDGRSPVKARPLVWLTRDGLEEALMEGTVYVLLPGRAIRIFNVDRNNGIPYAREIKKPRLQRRYWYFREISAIKGYGLEMETKITLLPKAAFAGDVFNLGLGKFIAVRFTNPLTGRREILLGILADTGGAFAGNLYQLDFLAGVFPSHPDFSRYACSLPEEAEVYFLFRRRK
ncbi:MAG: hypothetical protein V2A78_04645 [bacterium]